MSIEEKAWMLGKRLKRLRLMSIKEKAWILGKRLGWAVNDLKVSLSRIKVKSLSGGWCGGGEHWGAARGIAKSQWTKCRGCSRRHDGKMASVSESCNAVHGNSPASQDKIAPMPAIYQVNSFNSISSSNSCSAMEIQKIHCYLFQRLLPVSIVKALFFPSKY